MKSIDLIQQVITDQSQTYEWLAILQCMWELSSRTLTPYEITVIRQATDFHGDVNLTHWFDGPHRCPPDDMIREWASGTLETIKGECDE